MAKIVEKAAKAEPTRQASQVLDQAVQVAATIKEDKYKVTALSAIASQYAQVGQKDKSSQILAQAHKVAEAVNDDDSQVDALAAIASTYAAVGQKDKASQILAQAFAIAENIVVRAEDNLAQVRHCSTWWGLLNCWDKQLRGIKRRYYTSPVSDVIRKTD